MAPDDTTHPPDDSAPEEELPPLRRSFPVPRRRAAPVVEETVPDWQQWALRALLGIAVIMAAIAAWIRLRPVDPTPPATAIVKPDTMPPGPPDAARDLYLDRPVPEATGPVPVAAGIPPAETPPLPESPLTDLETRYLGALTAAMNHVPEAERAQFTAEIYRLRLGAPLPAPQEGLHSELARLQSIYRLQLNSGQSRR